MEVCIPVCLTPTRDTGRASWFTRTIVGTQVIGNMTNETALESLPGPTVMNTQAHSKTTKCTVPEEFSGEAAPPTKEVSSRMSSPEKVR